MNSILLTSFFILICIHFIELKFYVNDQSWMEKCLQLLTWILKFHYVWKKKKVLESFSKFLPWKWWFNSSSNSFWNWHDSQIWRELNWMQWQKKKKRFLKKMRSAVAFIHDFCSLWGMSLPFSPTNFFRLLFGAGLDHWNFKFVPYILVSTLYLS